MELEPPKPSVSTLGILEEAVHTLWGGAHALSQLVAKSGCIPEVDVTPRYDFHASWALWHIPVVPATYRAEVAGFCEQPGDLRPAWAT